MNTALPVENIGQTDVPATALGLGTAPLGGNMYDVSDADARAAMQAAYDGGVRFFDAAPFYGYGRAERRLGDFLRGIDAASYSLSTKAGRLLRPIKNPRAEGDPWQNALPFEAVFDYSYDAVMRSYEDSLQRLGLARIDVLLLHDVGNDTHTDADIHAAMFKTAMDGGVRALAELKGNGDIKAVGLGVNEKQSCLDAFKHADWDCFLLAGRYTLLEQDPLDDLLPLCVERGASLIIGGPYNSGLLAGGDTWNYHPAPQAMRDRARALGEVCAGHGIDLKAAALQFPLAHPAVTTTIPGARNAAEMNDNLGHMKTIIPAALWTDLRDAGLLHPDAPVPGG